MIDTTAALFAHLTADTNVTSALGVFNGGPAIMEHRQPPDGSIGAAPICLIDYPHGRGPSETSTHTISNYFVRLRLYGEIKDGEGNYSTLALDTAASAVRNSLHIKKIAVSGGSTMDLSVDGPVYAPTDDPLHGGRVMTLRWLIQED